MPAATAHVPELGCRIRFNSAASHAPGDTSVQKARTRLPSPNAPCLMQKYHLSHVASPVTAITMGAKTWLSEEEALLVALVNQDQVPLTFEKVAGLLEQRMLNERSYSASSVGAKYRQLVAKNREKMVGGDEPLQFLFAQLSSRSTVDLAVDSGKFLVSGVGVDGVRHEIEGEDLRLAVQACEFAAFLPSLASSSP